MTFTFVVGWVLFAAVYTSTNRICEFLSSRFQTSETVTLASWFIYAIWSVFQKDRTESLSLYPKKRNPGK